MQGNTRVGPTALYTAQAWRAGRFQNAELFDHPLGRLMYGAGSLTQKLLGPMLPPYMQAFNDYLWVRHRAFEERLDTMVPDMVIEIAAGLSPRGLTYARHWAGTAYVELDLPNMVAAKRDRLAGIRLPSNYYLAESDVLAGDFIEQLPVKPTSGQLLVIITEGLMDYLDMAEKQRAWQNLVALLGMAHPDSRYLTDCYPRQRVMPAGMAATLGVRGLGLLVGRRLGDHLYEDRYQAEQALRSVGFATVSRPDLVKLSRDTGLDPMACPFVLFECGV